MTRLTPSHILAVIAIAGAGVGGGCDSTRTYRLPSGIDVVAYDASKRGVYARQKGADGDRILVVAEPAPDVAREYTTLLDTSIQGLEGIEAAKLKAEFNSKVVDLARRSQTLQILRESLYRLSELNANGAISDEQVAALYTEVLRAVQTIALTELGNSDLPASAKARIVEEFYESIPEGGVLDPNRREP